jgi:hypothetical protein
MSDRSVALPLVRFWNAAERACVAADGTTPPGKQLGLWARVKRSGDWYAVIDDEPASSRAFKRAGLALASLADALPLIRKKRAGIVEYLYANNRNGEFSISVRSLPEESAFVRLLVRADDALDFAASRTWRGKPASPWDAACRRRLVRRDAQGYLSVIEPGVVWFVEWLERQGAQTIYSCEGHPGNFHVTFRARYGLAHRLAGVRCATVEAFRSGAFPQRNQWQLRLDRAPKDRDDRDTLLRRLANDIAKLSTSERDR